MHRHDWRAIRAFCADEPAWAPAVALLDEGAGAGWAVLAALPAARDTGGMRCWRALRSGVPLWKRPHRLFERANRPQRSSCTRARAREARTVASGACAV